jgi:metal-responsive CopG/Arc/MetJ family transcriptional regulator
MKVRTSVTISSELLLKLNELAGKRRSEIIEMALNDYFRKNTTKKSRQSDVETINKNADLINKQVAETLEFQAEW